MNRLMLWLTRPWPCKWGRHKRSDHNIGYGFGVVDFHCSRCEKRIESVPLADCSEYVRIKVGALQRRIGVP